MDPQLQALGIQLGEAAIRNTAGAVADRITQARARKRDQETIAELEDIVNDLQSDKAELVRIAQAFEAEMIAQRIADPDIEYIATNFVPLIRHLAELTGEDTGQDAEEIMQLVQSVLSVEAVKVLQLLGFNFRRAVGEPLTELLRRFILSKAPVDAAIAAELQRLSLARETSYLDVISDPEAHARLTGSS